MHCQNRAIRSLPFPMVQGEKTFYLTDDLKADDCIILPTLTSIVFEDYT